MRGRARGRPSSASMRQRAKRRRGCSARCKLARSVALLPVILKVSVQSVSDVDMSSIYSDLAGHISGYEGHAKISTLMFLLDKSNCPPDAEIHVVKLLEKVCKEQRHTILYSKLMHEYSGNSSISVLFEKQWPMDRDSDNRKEQTTLEQQLTEKRNQALKEEVGPDSVRNLAQLTLGAGADLLGALHAVPSHQGRP